ncbi:hypothetical protein [Deinococcus radiophilus]|uniref:hypothetical protein n=1 Tax=Deinococcus radiophilus TaxID=32062 RepID=UPI0036212EDF
MSNQQAILTPTELLAHWQGHRELTRRVIEAFPEEALPSITLWRCAPSGRWPAN